MRSVMGIVLGLAVLAPRVSFAADLTVAQILAKVSQTYGGLKSFRLVEEHGAGNAAFPTASQPSGPFGGRPERYETDLAVSIPGKVRLVVSSREAEVLLVSDAHKTWVYIPNLNEYTEAAAAPLLQELWANPVHFVTDDLARYGSLSHEPGRTKLRGEKTLSLGGQKVRCYVVQIPGPSGSPTLWIDERRFIVLRDELVSPLLFAGVVPNWTGPDTFVWTSRLTTADIGPISEDVFQFVVPIGARRVDSFTASAGPLRVHELLLADLLIGSEMEEVVTATQPAGSLGLESQIVVDLQGASAHDFVARRLGGEYGEDVGLYGFLGKIVVLDFWASWCEPCQAELAAIQKLHDELASKGVVFLGIDDEDSETVKSFVKTHGYNFPMLLDSKQTVHGLYGVRLAPTTVVIDRKGKIAAHYVGAAGEAQLRRALKSAGLNTTP